MDKGGGQVTLSGEDKSVAAFTSLSMRKSDTIISEESVGCLRRRFLEDPVGESLMPLMEVPVAACGVPVFSDDEDRFGTCDIPDR